MNQNNVKTFHLEPTPYVCINITTISMTRNKQEDIIFILFSNVNRNKEEAITEFISNFRTLSTRKLTLHKPCDVFLLNVDNPKRFEYIPISYSQF